MEITPSATLFSFPNGREKISTKNLRRSLYFQKIVEQHLPDPSVKATMLQHTFVLQDVSISIFKKTLQFLASQQLEIKQEEIAALFQSSQEFQIKEMEQVLLQHLSHACTTKSLQELVKEQSLCPLVQAAAIEKITYCYRQIKAKNRQLDSYCNDTQNFARILSLLPPSHFASLLKKKAFDPQQMAPCLLSLWDHPDFRHHSRRRPLRDVKIKLLLDALLDRGATDSMIPLIDALHDPLYVKEYEIKRCIKLGYTQEALSKIHAFSAESIHCRLIDFFIVEMEQQKLQLEGVMAALMSIPRHKDDFTRLKPFFEKLFEHYLKTEQLDKLELVNEKIHASSLSFPHLNEKLHRFYHRKGLSEKALQVLSYFNDPSNSKDSFYLEIFRSLAKQKEYQLLQKYLFHVKDRDSREYYVRTLFLHYEQQGMEKEMRSLLSFSLSESLKRDMSGKYISCLLKKDSVGEEEISKILGVLMQLPSEPFRDRLALKVLAHLHQRHMQQKMEAFHKLICHEEGKMQANRYICVTEGQSQDSRAGGGAA